jgi:hypothetical protein
MCLLQLQEQVNAFKGLNDFILLKKFYETWNHFIPFVRTFTEIRYVQCMYVCTLQRRKVHSCVWLEH